MHMKANTKWKGRDYNQFSMTRKIFLSRVFRWHFSSFIRPNQLVVWWIDNCKIQTMHLYNRSGPPLKKTTTTTKKWHCSMKKKRCTAASSFIHSIWCLFFIWTARDDLVFPSHGKSKSVAVMLADRRIDDMWSDYIAILFSCSSHTFSLFLFFPCMFEQTCSHVFCATKKKKTKKTGSLSMQSQNYHRYCIIGFSSCMTRCEFFRMYATIVEFQMKHYCQSIYAHRYSSHAFTRSFAPFR